MVVDHKTSRLLQTAAADSECCCLSPNKNQKNWITSHLRPLHWLPACQMIDFNRSWGAARRDWSSVDTNLSASAAFSKRCIVQLCFYFQGCWISQKRRKPLLAICFLTVSKALLLWAVSLLQSGRNQKPRCYGLTLVVVLCVGAEERALTLL